MPLFAHIFITRNFKNIRDQIKHIVLWQTCPKFWESHPPRKRLSYTPDDYSSMILEAKRKTTKQEPKPEPKVKTKRKKSPFELHEKFINEIKNYEKKFKWENI